MSKFTMSGFRAPLPVALGEEVNMDIDMSWLDATGDFKVFALMQVWGMITSFAYYPTEVINYIKGSIMEVWNDRKKLDEKYHEIMTQIEMPCTSLDTTLFDSIFDKLYDGLAFKAVYDEITANPSEGVRRALTIGGGTNFRETDIIIAAASTGILRPGIMRRSKSVYEQSSEKVPITKTRTEMSKKEEAELRLLARRSDRLLKGFILRQWSLYQQSTFGTLHFDAISRFVQNPSKSKIPSVLSIPQATPLAQLPINQINTALFNGLLTVAEVSVATGGSKEVSDATLCAAGGTECFIPESAVLELRRDVQDQEAFDAEVVAFRPAAAATIAEVRQTRSQAKKSGQTLGGMKRTRHKKRYTKRYSKKR